MAKRAGPSISVKMILTSTLLVLLTVVGLGFMQVINTGKIYDANAKVRLEKFKESLDERSQAATGGVVPPLKPLLIDGVWVGIWRRFVKPKGVDLEIVPHGKFSPAFKAAIQVEVDRYRRFLDAPITLRYAKR